MRTTILGHIKDLSNPAHLFQVMANHMPFGTNEADILLPLLKLNNWYKRRFVCGNSVRCPV